MPIHSSISSSSCSCIKVWMHGPLGRVPHVYQHSVAVSDDTWWIEMKWNVCFPVWQLRIAVLVKANSSSTELSRQETQIDREIRRQSDNLDLYMKTAVTGIMCPSVQWANVQTKTCCLPRSKRPLPIQQRFCRGFSWVGDAAGLTQRDVVGMFSGASVTFQVLVMSADDNTAIETSCFVDITTYWRYPAYNHIP